MPDRRRSPAPPPTPITAAARTYQASQGTSQDRVFQYESWQQEAWGFYDGLGEFRYGVDWLSAALSRVRLTAAELVPGGEEPMPITEGPAAQLVEALGGSVAGRAALMKSIGAQLSVPGEGWLVAERPDDKIPLEQADWTVKSTDEIRPARGGNTAGYVLRVDDNVWRPLHQDSLPVRIWSPHARWSWKADSAARAAIPIMRVIELLNRRIIATLVSRLAMNGLLLIPQEGDITTPPEYVKDGEDPFVNMLIDIAGRNIREPGAATASIPIPIKFPADFIEKWKHLTFGDSIDEQLLKERDEELGRLATTMNMPAEILTGMGNTNHWCTLPDVEIMTTKGWRTYDQLTLGEEVLTLNQDTGLSEWQSLQAVNTWDVVDEPMVEIKGGRHHSVTTLNHRWPTLTGASRWRRRNWSTTGELRDAATAAGHDTQNHDYLIIAAPNADLPTEAKYQDALVELVAWYFTEGDRGVRWGRQTPKVTISQSHVVNPDNCARIARALTALFGPASEAFDKGGRYASPESVRRYDEAHRLRAANPDMSMKEIGARLGVSGTSAAKYFKAAPKLRDNTPRWRTRQDGQITRFVLNAAAAEVILEHAPDRIVRLDFVQQLTAAQLELFIDTAVRGDGHYASASRTIVFGQKDPRMCDAFELALILSGRSPHSREHVGIGISKDGPRTKKQNMVVGSNRATFAPRGRAFTSVQHTGKIWCPTTANGTWLARYKGSVYFTGNSAWQLEETAIKLHISPVAETIAGGLTLGYLTPMLQTIGADLVGPNGGKIVVWYDTSELTARPDKSAQAQAAHDGSAISDAAYLRELGLDDADKPTDEELQRQLLVRLASMGNADAYNRLFGDTLAPTPGRRTGNQTPTPGGSQPSGPGDTGGATGLPVSATRPGVGTPPPTRDEPPPSPDDAMAALATRLGFNRSQAFAAVGTRTPPASTNGHHHNGSGKSRSRDGPRGRRR